MDNKALIHTINCNIFIEYYYKEMPEAFLRLK